MHIAILGTGMVGRTLADKLDRNGHRITMGTRDPAATTARTDGDNWGNASFAAWHGEHPSIALADFAQAAAFGELVIAALNGQAALDALARAGNDNLAGKILIDLTNPLDFSRGMPPSLFVSNTDSLGETIQRSFPDARVVKTLNTVNAGVMVDPASVAGGDHTIFVAGNDPAARAEVADLLKTQFGWTDVVDLGDITAARATEAVLPIWLRLMGTLNTPAFNFKLMR